MANFPTSVYSPSVVSDGQTISASRDNGQDAEITAIESGYLSGTAPLNSSNSTVANLSVTGGSTLGNAVASSLTVSAGSSFAVRPVMPPPEMALVFRDSTAALASSAASTIAWNAESYVSNSSMHSTGSNPERLTPQSTGLYRFTAGAGFGPASTIQTVQIDFTDSSGAQLGTHRTVISTVAGAGLTLQVVGMKRFDALGGYVVTRLALGALSTLSLSSGIGNTWASMEKL